jgi:hypothetical protein
VPEGGTPLLRADATDDVMHEDGALSFEDENSGPDVPAEVPARMVAVVVEGVFHGMRPALEGEL